MRSTSSKSLARIVGISAAAALSVSLAQAATYQFNVPSGSLLNPANYTANPAALLPADILQISNGGTATVVDGETATFAEIHVGQSGTGTATGTVNQSGGSLTLNDGLVVGRQGSAIGSYNLTGGSLMIRSLRLGGGTATSTGTMTVSGAGTTLSTGTGTATSALVVGIGTPGTGTLTLDQGATWNASVGNVFVGGDNAATGVASTALGGTGTLNIQGGAVLNLFAVNLAVGRNGNGNGTINVTSGGILNMNNSNGSDAILNLANVNGTSTIPAGASVPTATLNLSGAGSSITVPRVLTGLGNATLNLNGGTFTTRRFDKGVGNATINFNGTTMVAQESTGDFYGGFSRDNLNIQAGGQIFDTNGNAVGIMQGMSGVGGLTKIGAGTLTLTGFSTYAGPTTIRGGTLTAGVSGVLPSTSNLNISSGTFDLSGQSHTLGTLTVGEFSILDFNSPAFSNSLIFAASNSQTWTGTLTLQNFEVGTDTLSFTSASGLTASQLAAISLVGYQATGLDSAGVVQFVAVPEPASLALLAIGSLLASRRRRR